MLVSVLAMALLLLLAIACVPTDPESVFVAMSEPGVTEDGVAYGVEDILVGVNNAPDPNGWYKVFDGSAVGLTPQHNIRAFSFNEWTWLNPLPAGGHGFSANDFENLPDLYLSFSPNRIHVPGISGWVYGQDVVRFQETMATAVDTGEFDLFFDGSDVGLTTVQEKIDALGFYPPEYIDYFFGANADVPLDCNAGIFFMSTAGTYKVKGASGAALSGDGSDILLFCGFNYGPDTAGQWYRVLRGSELGLKPASVLIALDIVGFEVNTVTAASPDDLDSGVTIAFATRKPFTAPGLIAPGQPNRVYSAGTNVAVTDELFDFNDNLLLPAVNGRVDSFSLFDVPGLVP